MRGDDEAAARWRALFDSIRSPDLEMPHYLAVAYQYAVVAVHRGRFDEALGLLHLHPDRITTWQNGMWRPWYAALWAEAGRARRLRRRVRAGRRGPGAHHGQRHRGSARGPRSGSARRARRSPASIAAGLDDLGARYQAARTRVLAGGAAAERGERELLELGTQPLH